MFFKRIAVTTEIDCHNCQIAKKTLKNAMILNILITMFIDYAKLMAEDKAIKKAEKEYEVFHVSQERE